MYCQERFHWPCPEGRLQVQSALLQIFLCGQSHAFVAGFVVADTDILREIPPAPEGQLQDSHLRDPAVQSFLTATAPLSLGRCGGNVLGTGVKPFPCLCSCSHSPGLCSRPSVLPAHVLHLPRAAFSPWSSVSSAKSLRR